jgi:ABC-type antimicrobial peptide transport system permease subunit
MIKLFQAQKLSLKKINFSKGKSLFVIIPISLMFAIIVFGASQAKNLVTVAHNSIFSPIQGQNEVIEVEKTLRGPFSDTSTSYSATDITLVSAIDSVQKASLIYELPLQNVTTTTLFDGKKITISNLAGLDDEYAKLYTNNSFTYNEGEAIPIILNANDFYETYEDWQGKTELTVDFSSTSTATAQSPVKTKAVTYNRDELIGKEITVSIGGLDEISDVSQSSTTSGIKYTQKTEAEISKEVIARKNAIAKYYDYSKISTPLTYKFVIVGISEGTDKTKAYVPTYFAQKLLQDYFTNAVNARNKTAIPTAERNATYVGLVYDGVTISSDSESTMFANIRKSVTSQVNDQFDSVNKQIDSQNKQIDSANSSNNAARKAFEDMRPGDRPPRFSASSISAVSKLNAGNIKISYAGSAATYTIPGLVYVKNRTTSELTAEVNKFDFTKSIPLASTSILVKVDSLDNRDQVVTDLNAKGFTYQDFSQYKAFDKLEGYIKLGLEIGSLVFMGVTALFILINMAKFVSEGKKEIGIFRALGATKGDIRKIFILQSVTYILLSLVIGGVVGAIAIFATSSYMVSAAQGFINTAIGSTVTLSGAIKATNFMGFDMQTIPLYAAGLVIVTLIVSLIPSGQAAKISPVEAIRNS